MDRIHLRHDAEIALAIPLVPTTPTDGSWISAGSVPSTWASSIVWAERPRMAMLGKTLKTALADTTHNPLQGVDLRKFRLKPRARQASR
jgi:hypothetical protein